MKDTRKKVLNKQVNELKKAVVLANEELRKSTVENIERQVIINSAQKRIEELEALPEVKNVIDLEEENKSLKEKIGKLISKSTFDEAISEKNAAINRLHMQFSKAVNEADAKATQCTELSKELGQAKIKIKNLERENESIRNSNVSLSKEMNKVMDDSMALRDEMRFCKESAAEREKYVMQLESSIKEKDDLIKQLQRPWYRKIFG